MGARASGKFFYHTSEKQTENTAESESDANTTLKSYLGWYNRLEFKEQICWAFDVLPSQLIVLYWQATYADIRFKMKMRISERMADFSQHFENLGIVVTQALGGDQSPPEDKPKSQPTKNWAEAQMVLSDLFG